MSKRSIAVPDVVGLTFANACTVGIGAGLVVRGYGPDGSPVTPESEGLVVEQEPLPPDTIEPGQTLRLRVGRGDGGAKDPEPRRPDPEVHSDRGDVEDPDELELVPA